MRRILFVDSGKLKAMRWHRGHVETEDEFAADENGYGRFALYVDKHADSVFLMLADVADEAFHFEDIPFLRGRDRIALIKRKLARHYPATPFTAALSLGRTVQGRRDERMLFSALTRPQQFEPWLQVLKTGQAALGGIFSLPQVVTAVSRPSTARHFLLVTLTCGGLRQTFVENDCVRFSRLTPLTSGGIEEAAAACARETAKTWRYLEGQHLIPAEPLAVQILVHPSHVPAFRVSCADDAGLRFRYLDLAEQAARCGLKTPLSDSRAETLFAHVLARRMPRGQFAHADARYAFRLRNARSALRLAGGGILAACLLFAAAKGLEMQRLRESIAALRAERESHERRHESLLATLPELPVAADRFLAVTGRYEELLQRSPGPASMYRRISAALDDNPAIELQRLNWSVAERAESGGEGPYAMAQLEAELPPALANDVGGQDETVRRFSGSLLRDPAVRVHVTRLPSDEQSGKRLSGDGESIQPPAPGFSLQIIQRLERPWR